MRSSEKRENNSNRIKKIAIQCPLAYLNTKQLLCKQCQLPVAILLSIGKTVVDRVERHRQTGADDIAL